MAVDYFNNSSNDYINPSLPVCPGVADADSGSFEFIPKRSLGVISGSEIMAALDFSDFSQPVTGWTKERKTIQSGEVVFIQGLTKGISYRTLVFPIPSSIDISSNNAEFYASVDMSIGYYRNFRYITIDVSAVGDYDQGIAVGNALDIAVGDAAIGINIASNIAIDASNYFSFTGSTAGYDFNVSNLKFTLDGSTHTLIADPAQTVESAKYPNTAMLGYVLRVLFPASITDESSKYINLNHIPTELTYYEASTGGSEFVQYTKLVTAGATVSTDAIMSAGDYLNYVDVNGYWEKVGQLRVWLSTEDPASNSAITNLINGFYLYNPQSFPVIVEYMTIV